MKICKLLLKDFRCFENFIISFSEAHNLHVIIAENMVGKSAIMAALRLTANTYTSGIKSENQIKINDHRIVGNNPIADISLEVSIESTAYLLDSKGKNIRCVWKKYKSKPYGEKTKVEIISGVDPRKESKNINKLVNEGKSIQPLLSFIGTEYIHVESSNTVSWDINGKSIDGYKGCFEDKSIKNFLFNWIGRIDGILGEMSRKAILAETYKDIPENAMYAFKTAIKSVLPEISEIEWSNDAKQPIVKLKDGSIRPFGMLSDGYRYLILLAGELATRAFILNKHLGKDVLKKVNGMVIIDEFGIHLHPSLQNDTLILLQKTFPNVQFIVSTHSPMLLNGLKKEQIHIISVNKKGDRVAENPEEDIVGLGANEILTKVFGLATTMDNEFLELNDEYTKLFKLNTEKGLNPEETKRFRFLSEKLSQLRLDPQLNIILEDPITSLVKKNIQDRMMESKQLISNIMDESLEMEKKVENIVGSIFNKNQENNLL